PPGKVSRSGFLFEHLPSPVDVAFPRDYPTGCLLGCVDVLDCLSQEQFKDQHPSLSQESTSPFVFVCVNPQELLVKFPMKGQHKICKCRYSYSCYFRYSAVSQCHTFRSLSIQLRASLTKPPLKM
ncbi:hypothetical protein FKM82_023962, partial [Ascaphus truei]